MKTIDNFFEQNNAIPDRMRVDGFRCDGTSNYLININDSGTTWAYKLLIPAFGIGTEEFVKEKGSTEKAAFFLCETLSAPARIEENITLHFNGNGTLVTNESIMEFLRAQNARGPLLEIDNVSKRSPGEKAKAVIAKNFPLGITKKEDNSPDKEHQEYFLNYTGPFFVSVGAPAWETLDQYPDLMIAAAKSLHALHAKTGLKTYVDEAEVVELVRHFSDLLEEACSGAFFEAGSKEERSLIKYEKNWNEHGNPELSAKIFKEILFRSSRGKVLLDQFIKDLPNGYSQEMDFRCFTHNDAHCENFIIVDRAYRLPKSSNNLCIDRVFLNHIYHNSTVDRIAAECDYGKKNEVVWFREVLPDDEERENVIITERCQEYEIHLIDIDDATGFPGTDKCCYLYDLIKFAISASNLSSIKKRSETAIDIVRSYYSYSISEDV